MAKIKDEEVAVDQVKLILDGEQKRDNTVFPAAFPGEGEHQMKGLFAEVNPIHVAEAEGFRARERRTAEHQHGEALTSSVSPPESVVRSGTNEYTKIERVTDRTVAGDRVADNYSEKMGITTDPLRVPGSDLTRPDSQKVDPRTGVQWQVDGDLGERRAVVLTDEYEGGYIRVDELNSVEPSEPSEDDEDDDDDERETVSGPIEPPEGVSSDDTRSFEGVEVPPEGLGEPVETDAEGQPVIDPETGEPVVDEEAAKAEQEAAEAAEAAAEAERQEQEKAAKAEAKKSK